MSSYETKIAKILNNHNINFEREKTFSTLKGGKFRYDFYCYDKNILIEINGEQHYKVVPKFHKTRLDFIKGQEHDRRKIS